METKILKVVQRCDGRYVGELEVVGSTRKVKICVRFDEVDLKPLADVLQKYLEEHPEIVEQAEAFEN